MGPERVVAEATERAALVGLVREARGRAAAEASLDELAALARAAGAHVELRVLQERPAPDPALFFGRGRVAALAAACAERGLNLVIVDNELTPAQRRNLERALQRKVVDRTELILDVFARRARTREGKLQVELAQLRYRLPRLVGAGAELSRLGGGIGTRGPGETKLETDRRRIRHRIRRLLREITLVRERRGRLRARRQKRALPVVALVGYTNAGKTTLFNALTGADALVSAAPFATLDPLVRQVRLPDGRRFLVTDTVGFITRLPPTLVAAFRATLEEVCEADVLVHVIDAASPQPLAQAAAVRQVLEQVGALEVPRIEVLNKWDLLDEGARRRLKTEQPEAVAISALRGEGLDALRSALVARLGLDVRRVVFEFDEAKEADRRRLARLYRDGRVLWRKEENGRVAVEAEVPAGMLAEWAAALA